MGHSVKTYPTGTTKEQWDAYEVKRTTHTLHMMSIKPEREQFADGDSFEKAKSEWRQKLFMDAPNEPGYYRANND